MKDLKLIIDLLPKGAWGNNLSKTLPKKDWDTLREFAYKKARHRCTICGKNDEQLEAHEVWDFDIKSKTQTLKDIIALCTACHGVKHLRHSQRIGYGKHAEAHFCKISQCNALTFAGHCAEAENLFNERNKILRWRIVVNLDKFGGKGIEYKQREIPLIVNPYEGIDWATVNHVRDLQSNAKTVESYAIVLQSDERTNNGEMVDTLNANAVYFHSVTMLNQTRLFPEFAL